jgi:hypothetical protein
MHTKEDWMEIKAQVEAGIQWRHPVIGRGLNENETSTNEVSYKSSPCSLDPAFSGITQCFGPNRFIWVRIRSICFDDFKRKPAMIDKKWQKN